MTPEFSRPLRAHEIGGTLRRQSIEASDAERAALAGRFDLLGLDRLVADISVRREAAGIRVTGRIDAAGTQPCVATAEPVPFLITETLALLLTENQPEGEEIELADADLDSEPLVGDIIDIGELAAQALALALDPYPRSTAPAPGVISEEAARAASSPFAVLRKE
jgi:uncharacterized metal-binding protein YceD (DUF177 family)